MTRGEVELEFFKKAGGLDEHIVMMMADEIVRLRAILSMLREPSEAVVKAAASTYFTTESLQRAVAAAEREVGA